MLLSEFLKWKVNDSDFTESEHPRESDGKFTEKGGGSSSSNFKAAKTEGNMRVQADGSALPEYIARLKIPPAWTDVEFDSNPDATLLVKGKDAKGRLQYVYSDAHWAKAAEAKFARVNELNQKFEEISKQNKANLKGENKEPALVIDLIMKTGIRPGSDEDTKAKVKAYGATTLEGRHVIQEGGKIYLNFIGKKGVDLKIPIQDSDIGRMLIERKMNRGDNKKLFDVSNSRLLNYTHMLDGGGFKTKDFRTLLGTKTAMNLVKTTDRPSNAKDYKRKVMDIAKKVASVLGNTPSVALGSYISPVVFADWRKV